jgi:hypothetical protein
MNNCQDSLFLRDPNLGSPRLIIFNNWLCHLVYIVKCYLFKTINVWFLIWRTFYCHVVLWKINFENDVRGYVVIHATSWNCVRCLLKFSLSYTNLSVCANLITNYSRSYKFNPVQYTVYQEAMIWLSR